MAKRTGEVNKMPAPTTVPFPRMLTLDDVQEILNLGKPLVYALVKSGELRAAQFGGRSIWGVRQEDLAAYIDARLREDGRAHCVRSDPRSRHSRRGPDMTAKGLPVRPTAEQD